MKKQLALLMLQMICAILSAQYLQSSNLNYPLVSNPVYKPGWTVVFQDEFNSQSVFDANWYYPPGTLCSSWSYANPSNCNIVNGKLIMSTIRFTRSAICSNSTSYFDVGYARTKSDIFQPNLFFEIKCKQPYGQLHHTGFWTWGNHTSHEIVNEKNICGDISNYSPDQYFNFQWSEIDIFEEGNLGSNQRTFHTNYHWVPTDKNFKYQCAELQPVSDSLPIFNDAFYTVSAYWTNSYINWYLNNNIVRKVIDFIPQNKGWLWLGNIVEKANNNDVSQISTMLSDPNYDGDYEIEYVRVYKLNSEIASPISGFGISQGWTNQNERPRFVADINGDGKSDVIGFGTQYVITALSQCNSTTTSFGSNQFPLSNFTKEQGFTDMNSSPRFVCDINNDNKADILGILSGTLYGSISWSDQNTAHYYSMVPIFNYFNYNNSFINQNTTPLLTGDFNGDGKGDFVFFGPETRISLSNTSSTSTSPSFLQASGITGFNYSSSWPDQNTTPRIIADVNNDGKDDIIGFGSSGVYVSLSACSSTTVSFTAPVLKVSGFGITQGFLNNSEFPRMLADVNADGKSDIIGFGSNGVYVSISNSTATNASFYSPTFELSYFTKGQGWTNNNDFPRMVCDINNDNKADIIGFNNKGLEISLSNSSTTAAVFYNQNLVFEYFTKFSGWNTQSTYPRFFEDINNDGYNDLVGYGYNKFYTFNGFNPATLKSTEIDDEISYDKLKSEIDGVNLFPNPVNNTLNINSETTLYKVEIYDFKGSLITRFDNVNSNTINIDVSQLNNGLYLVKINNERGINTKKLIKQ